MWETLTHYPQHVSMFILAFIYIGFLWVILGIHGVFFRSTVKWDGAPVLFSFNLHYIIVLYN
jgi:hypothetical protein